MKNQNLFDKEVGFEAMNYLAKMFKCDFTIAFGDQLNDIPMIKEANIGVAMLNGKDKVKEEANYIIMRGKNRQGLEIVKEASAGHSLPNTDLRKLRIILIYESVMLDNYYRARSVAKDNYFDSPASRAEMDSEVVIMVTNLLPKQALRLLSKHATLTLAQYNELEATLQLLNQQQINGLITESEC